MVMVVAYTPSGISWDGTHDFILTTKVERGGGAITVWCRRPGLASTTGLIDGSLYDYTAP